MCRIGTSAETDSRFLGARDWGRENGEWLLMDIEDSF
jgi:hypothetical protein